MPRLAWPRLVARRSSQWKARQPQAGNAPPPRAVICPPARQRTRLLPNTCIPCRLAYRSDMLGLSASPGRRTRHQNPPPTTRGASECGLASCDTSPLDDIWEARRGRRAMGYQMSCHPPSSRPFQSTVARSTCISLLSLPTGVRRLLPF